MAKRLKDKTEKQDKNVTPSNNDEKTKEELAREEEIRKQKEKRKQKREQEKQQEEELKRKNKQKKANAKKVQKERTNLQKERERQKIAKKREKEKTQKQLAKQHKQLEKQQKLEQERKRQQREKRIKQKKLKQNEEEEFEYEANTAIKMTMKNNKRKQQREQISKQQKEMAKKRKRKHKIITVSVILVLITGSSIFALTSPIFNIKQIQVIGNEQISNETIESISGIQLDENIFRFLKYKISKNIKTNPYIENVEITRVLPNTVQIQIEERTKKFAIEFLNGFAMLNNQGYILEISEDKQELPIIKGLIASDEEINVGSRLKEEDLQELGVLIKIMDTFKDNGLDEQVDIIEITAEKQYIITMGQENKIIYLGDKSNLSNKIIYVKAILEETKGLEGEIFVNGDLNNKFKPYFREKVS